MITCPICLQKVQLQESLALTNKASNDLGYHHYACYDHINRLAPKTHFSCYTDIQNQITQFFLYSHNMRITCLNKIPQNIKNNINIGWEVSIIDNDELWKTISKGLEPLSLFQAYQYLLRCHNLKAFL